MKGIKKTPAFEKRPGTRRASSSAHTAKSARAARPAVAEAAAIRSLCRAMLMDQLICNQASWRGVAGKPPMACPWSPWALTVTARHPSRQVRRRACVRRAHMSKKQRRWCACSMIKPQDTSVIQGLRGAAMPRGQCLANRCLLMAANAPSVRSTDQSAGMAGAVAQSAAMASRTGVNCSALRLYQPLLPARRS